MKMKGILTMSDGLISFAGKGFEFNSHMEKITQNFLSFYVHGFGK